METTPSRDVKIAYFSMEIALASDLPTYSGGLGVLAGDTLRSAADLELPLVAITLIYQAGYFYQLIDPTGFQTEREIEWEFSSELVEEKTTITLEIEDKTFEVKAWRYNVVGSGGHIIPVYLLDSDVEGNEDWQKRFTHVLYDATPYQRAVQEMILGIGGVRLLEALGYTEIETYHMNEGHASMLTLELLNKYGSQEEVRRRCVFTTHTPVPAGHDKFDWSLMLNIFRDRAPENFRDLAGVEQFNTTVLAINFSRYVNGVARKHGEVTREMFPEYADIIDHITNGIHVGFWVAKEMRTVYNKFLPGWHVHPSFFNRAMEIDSEDLWQAHWDCKKHLIDYEKSHSWILLDKNLLTVGYARRITQYKRPLLLFNNLEKLAKISKGKVQYVFAGKCHPKDNSAKEFIKKIHDYSKTLWDSYRVRVAFLENYDMDLSHLMVSGVDVWLNTPKRYQEASGTSGMKAAANAVPNFSVLDGWWIEGYEMDSLAGWKIGPTPNDPNPTEDNWNKESAEIYNTLDQEIIPLYYSDRNGWVNRMKHAIKLAAYFNTHRQVYEYAAKAYQLEKQPRWKSLALF